MLKLKWSQVLNPVNYNSKRITKPDKDFAKKIDFKDIEYPVKVIDIHKIKKKKKKRIPSALVFLVMKIRKNIQSMYQKNVEKNMLIYN